MTVEPLCLGGGGGGVVSHPLQLTTGLVVNSFIITNPTLAGERMFRIPKVSNLSEQKYIILIMNLLEINKSVANTVKVTTGRTMKAKSWVRYRIKLTLEHFAPTCQQQYP